MDFAQTGIKIDTSDVELTVQRLKKISPSAKAAQQAANGMASSMREASIIFAKATQVMVSGMLALAQSSGTASKASIKNMSSISKQATELVKAAEAQRILKKTTDSASQSLTKQSTAVMTLSDRFNKLASQQARASSISASFDPLASRGGFGGAGRRDGTRAVSVNRFNTANIAAQFQDIGVTAAMGMNPMLVALQQGTQLSAILNSMERPLASLADSFKQIINVTALLSIGLTALVVVGFQMVDWAAVSTTVLNGLVWILDGAVNVLDAFAGAIVLAATALTLWKLPVIISGLVSMTKAIWGATTAMGAFLAANPFILISAAIVGAATLLYQFRDDIANVLGFDLLDVLKKAANFMIGTFVFAYESIKSTFTMLPTYIGYITVETVNMLVERLKPMQDMLNATIAVFNSVTGSSIKPVFFSTTENPFAEPLVKKIIEAHNNVEGVFEKDYVGGIVSTVSAGLSKMSTKIGEVLTTKATEAIEPTEGLAKSNAELTETLDKQSESLTANKKKTEELSESMKFAKNATNGFLSTMRQGVQQGKSLWESFGDAVTNVLDRIFDKIQSNFVDDLFSGFGSGLFGNFGGGFLSDIGSFLFSAKGNAFSPSGVEAFAKGGTFTNSIVSSPTMFTFANGGKFGVMGEAGPEAVMPLRRGADGSLGVQMVGGGGNGGDVNVIVYNNSNAQATTREVTTPNGKTIEVMIDEAVARNLNTPSSRSYKALKSFNSQPLAKG